MPQRPNAINLMLCDQVVFEQGTLKPYLLGVFTGVAVTTFPTVPQRFDVFAALTDGLGDVIIDLNVTHMDMDQVVYNYEMRAHFPDPLRVVNVRHRVRELTFYVPGIYLFALSIDDQEIAARRIRVYLKGQVS